MEDYKIVKWVMFVCWLTVGCVCEVNGILLELMCNYRELHLGDI